MPSIYYQRVFVPGAYYHVYNRGANKGQIFHDDKDYVTFIKILGYYLLHPTGIPQSILDRTSDYKVPNLVKTTEATSCTLLAYCLMPNHFHLKLRQEESSLTISDLMRRLSVTYAMYYNDRHHHSGAIFQGKYKNVRLTSEVQWLYLSKYIHRNPLHLQSSEPCNLADYPYSSYQNYIGKRSDRWLNTSEILGRYTRNPYEEYARFVNDGGDVGPIKKVTLDVDEIQA